MRAIVFFITLGIVSTGIGYAETLLGGGTQNNPWVIRSLADFDEFVGDPNCCISYVRLEADINLAGRIYSTAVIAPYSLKGPAFSGVFDGNGHIISNLTIDTASADTKHLGLFGEIDRLGGKVTNLVLENVDVTGGDKSFYIGGLCGRNLGTIVNCFISSSVVGGNGSYHVGGLCGENTGIVRDSYWGGSVISSHITGGLCGYNRGVISSCYATGSVTGGNESEKLGSLCGSNFFGFINNCYATGSVVGGEDSSCIGGLCGDNDRATISNCYATGSVEGGNNSERLGGLCGSNGGYTSNCYATGSVTGGDGSSNLGGLSGSSDNHSLSNCYYLNLADGGGPDNGTGTVLSDEQMRQQDSFLHWDFTNGTADGIREIWQMPAGGGYPVLSSFNGYSPVVLSGNGTEANPYLISNVMELGAMYHYSINACFKLTSDIDLAGITWSSAIVPAFGGCFDGNGHTIHNLNIEGRCHLGLFGRIASSGAEVKNLDLKNVNITGGQIHYGYLGGLCGQNRGTINKCNIWGSVTSEGFSHYLGGLCGENRGTIINSYFGGSVVGEVPSNYLGGLCGTNGGTISRCYTSGSVTGGDESRYIGGLCGYNGDGTISKCYSTSFVEGGDGSRNLGGLCGNNLEGTISNCYATGSVKAGDDTKYLGGLCGYNDNGAISNCYATGSITVDYVGAHLVGLCGKSNGPYDESTISNSFWDVEISGVGKLGNDLYGATGKTTEDMQTGSTFVDAGWDFDSDDGDGADWMMLREGEDYPRLGWQEVYVGDIAGLYGVDMVDLVELAWNWGALECPEGCADADIDGDGVVGFGDLGVMAERWRK